MLDLNKPITTRGGRPARVICSNSNSPYPIVALIEDSNGQESLCSYTVLGAVPEQVGHSWDLINPVEKTTKWANVYKDSGVGCWHLTKESVERTERLFVAVPSDGTTVVGNLKGYFEDNVLVNVEFIKK
jgi:hypothetical protein